MTTESQPQQITLKEAVLALSDDKVRRIVALLGLGQAETEPADQEDAA